jgi:GR25 family glycosyltransferase involved in LPS biosynthesis
VLLSKLPIYVISVKSFTDRHEHIEKLAKSFGFHFEYVFDHDADELTELDWKRVNREMSPNSVSNVLKHIEAQKLLIESGSQVGLVLEDDVLLFDGFMDNLAQTLELSTHEKSGWLVFLGGADNKIDSRFTDVTELTLIENQISTAEAYLIDVTGCLKRQEWLAANIIDRQADHQLKLIDQTLGIRHFWTSRPLVTQGSITGRFTTTLDQSRAKHSAAFLRLKYHWNCWRRQVYPRFFGRFLRSTRLFDGR